jgi:DNA-binding protein HU-beta
MNYQEFIKSIAQTTKKSQKETEQLTAALTAVMVNEIKHDNAIVLPDLGTLELKTKSARRLYSPNTKDYVEVPASKTIAFKPTDVMKGKVKSTKK